MVSREQSMQVFLLSDGSDPKEYDEERQAQHTFDEIADVVAGGSSVDELTSARRHAVRLTI
jgi:hypothetical protein